MGDESFARSTPLGFGAVAASTRVGLTDRSAALGVFFGAIFGGVLGGSFPIALGTCSVPLEPRSKMMPLRRPSQQESWAS